MPPDLPILAFASPVEFKEWLRDNVTSSGLWLQISKKDATQQSLTYAQALDIALCYGWIDGQKKAYDAQSWLQRFTPRRARSAWSKVNTQHTERLIKAGKMQPAGLAQIEAAKADGRWQRAYDSAKSIVMPEDFLTLLKQHKKAEAFYNTLNKANTYAIAYRLQTAKKPETRAKRMQLILEMMKKGKKFH